MNGSRSPSRTPCTLPVSCSVRRSFTIWYGCMHVAADLAAEPDPLLLAPDAGQLGLALCRSRSASRAFSIAMASAGFWSWERSTWHDTTMPVGRCVSRTADDGLVDVLPAGARRPEDVHLDVRLVDLDRPASSSWSIGNHVERRERRLALALRVERAHAHEAVHARSAWR